MQRDDVTYFAPDIPFADLDLTGQRLPQQLLARMEGYYLQPADHCIEYGHAFAAGLLAVTCLDAVSRFAHGPNRERRGVKDDFLAYTQVRLPSFSDKRAAAVLYENFRNGLVHEARLKEGSQFTLGSDQTLLWDRAGPVIDAGKLLAEVWESVRQVVAEMADSEPFQGEVLAYVNATFAAELEVVRRG